MTVWPFLENIELIDKAAVIIPPGFCRKSRINDLAPSLRNFLTVALNCLTVGSLKVEIVMTPTCLFAGASFPVTVSTVIFFRFMEKVACLLPRLTVTATVVPILPRILATAWVTVSLDTSLPFTLSSTSPTFIPAFFAGVPGKMLAMERLL